MRRLLILLIVWTLCPAATYGQGRATLVLIVRDEADRPVVGLTLSLTDANGMRQSATTDASGRATFTGVRGTTVTLIEGHTATGQPLALDPTTPRDGLVLGLIPNATRVVPFRLVDGLLFLDPLEVFAGTDESAGAVPAPLAGSTPTLAAIPLAAAGAPDAVAVPDRTADLPVSAATPGALLWCIGVPLLCLLCLTALLIVTRRRQ